MYLSEYCDVKYEENYNVVFVKWKKFCCWEDYRKPLVYALEIIDKYKCDYVADTRDGFENIEEDTKWVAEYLMPKAVEKGCKCIYFIIDEDNSLKEELEGQAQDSADLIEFKYIFGLEELAQKKVLSSMIEKDDWRLQQDLEHLQGKYINGTDGEEIVSHTSYLTACIFCREQVEDNPHQWWYVPEDMSCCICEECYQDFKESFRWKELDGWDIDWSIGGGNNYEE